VETISNRIISVDMNRTLKSEADYDQVEQRQPLILSTFTPRAIPPLQRHTTFDPVSVASNTNTVHQWNHDYPLLSHKFKDQSQFVPPMTIIEETPTDVRATQKVYETPQVDLQWELAYKALVAEDGDVALKSITRLANMSPRFSSELFGVTRMANYNNLKIEFKSGDALNIYAAVLRMQMNRPDLIQTPFELNGHYISMFVMLEMMESEEEKKLILDLDTLKINVYGIDGRPLHVN